MTSLRLLRAISLAKIVAWFRLPSGRPFGFPDRPFGQRFVAFGAGLVRAAAFEDLPGFRDFFADTSRILQRFAHEPTTAPDLSDDALPGESPVAFLFSCEAQLDSQAYITK